MKLWQLLASIDEAISAGDLDPNKEVLFATGFLEKPRERVSLYMGDYNSQEVNYIDLEEMHG